MSLLLRILPDQVCSLYPPRPAEDTGMGYIYQLAEIISKQTMRTEDRMNRMEDEREARMTQVEDRIVAMEDGISNLFQ